MDTQGQRQKRSSTETFDPPALEPCSKTKVSEYSYLLHLSSFFWKNCILLIILFLVILLILVICSDLTNLNYTKTLYLIELNSLSCPRPDSEFMVNNKDTFEQ